MIRMIIDNLLVDDVCRYLTIANNPVRYDAAGNLELDSNGYGYEKDN